MELVRGSGGIYLVEVDGAVVARKAPGGDFPSEEEVVAAVRSAG